MEIDEFQKLVVQKGRELYRDMPWRQDTRPYYILVSELMLQQTQVDRVIPKFNQFIQKFPNERILAESSLADVLKTWQGLGYNRRAQYLHAAARKVVAEYNDLFPSDLDQLLSLPGIGPNTAGAILAYAYNKPVVFIETNIRTVYIHHFFADQKDITDAQIRELVGQTIDQRHPRAFYWAVMDYGSYLKRSGINNISQGKHYKKQSPLKGSLREARGIVLRALASSEMDIYGFRRDVAIDDRFEVALESLIRDGLVEKNDDALRLSTQ